MAEARRWVAARSFWDSSRLHEALGMRMKEPRDTVGCDEGPERTDRVLRTFDSSPAKGG